MRRKHSAFSLMELMIVIAIIGILAAISIPAYREYVVRSTLSEGLTSLSLAKQKAMERFSLTGSLPATLAEMGLTADQFDDENVNAIAISTTGCTNAGANQGSWCVYLTYNDSLTGLSSSNAGLLGFSAAVSGNQVTWTCTTNITSNAASIPRDLLPGTCAAPTS